MTTNNLKPRNQTDLIVASFKVPSLFSFGENERNPENPPSA
jgi:hypothetical protein